LWTDSRYWNEASLQLDSSLWTLKKAGLPSTPTIPKWIALESKKKALHIGMDPFVHPASFPKEIKTALEEEGVEQPDQTQIKTINTNLVDQIWNQRPAVPTSPWRVHPLEYAGMTWQTKVTKVRRAMQEKKATMAVFSTLDDVAYLLNLRCQGDIDTCPVGIAYATVTMDTVTLFVHQDKMKASPEEVHQHLQGVGILPYDSIVEAVQQHVKSTEKAKVWLDASRANYALTLVIPEKSLLDAQNAITPMKGVKNIAELDGMREAHIVDGVAMAKFIAWLQETLKERPVSEVEIDQVLTGYRAEQKGFNEVSFPTIAGVGPNAAIIHYRATEGSDILKYLDTTQPILIDSGGQYSYGTTDVTRTWHFGTPTAEFVDAYTRVLKGNIGLDQMVRQCGDVVPLGNLYCKSTQWIRFCFTDFPGERSWVCVGRLCSSSSVASRKRLWPRNWARCWGR
jgi:Xaa-Pro aminopeptidase